MQDSQLKIEHEVPLDIWNRMDLSPEHALVPLCWSKHGRVFTLVHILWKPAYWNLHGVPWSRKHTCHVLGNHSKVVALGAWPGPA